MTLCSRNSWEPASTVHFAQSVFPYAPYSPKSYMLFRTFLPRNVTFPVIPTSPMMVESLRIVPSLNSISLLPAATAAIFSVLSPETVKVPLLVKVSVTVISPSLTLISPAPVQVLAETELLSIFQLSVSPLSVIWWPPLTVASVRLTATVPRVPSI